MSLLAFPGELVRLEPNVGALSVKTDSVLRLTWLFSSGMTTLALTDLLGAMVYDPSGAAGRVREVTLTPQEDRARISSLIVKTKSGDRIVPYDAVSAINGGIRTS